MGSAMLAGWREDGLSPSVVVDPAPAAESLAGAGVAVIADASALPDGFAPYAVIFAVKPQNAGSILAWYSRFAQRAVFLSIMAGKLIGGMRELLGPEAAIVRAMPNTPAAVRRGVTVATKGGNVSEGQAGLCDRLLSAIGKVAWVEDERLLDAVTAVSGSGPAYVFLLAELMEQSAVAEGLPPDLARLLARETVAGSGALLAATDEESAALRRAVTSPGGTTERALRVLMADTAWPLLVRQAIAAAVARSRELAS